MTLSKALSLVTAMSLGALGALGCGSDTPANPDANTDPDATVGPACTAVTAGAQAAIAGNQFTFEINDNYLGQVEFYSSAPGTYDLSAGDDESYATCVNCFLVFDQVNTDIIFFQSGGSLTLDVTPGSGTVKGSVTDLTVTEVTIDDDTLETLPVDGGTCFSLGSFALSVITIPDEWTCEAAAYADGTTCDCACGDVDLDCAIPTNPIEGCADPDQACISAECSTTCSVLGVQEGCTTGVCTFFDDTFDVCNDDASSIDPAVIGAECLSADGVFCAVDNTIALGICDYFSALNDTVCKTACDSDDDCTAAEVCLGIVGDRGLCYVPPPVPANDTCNGAVTITVPSTTPGTTLGAVNDIEAGLDGATCTNYEQRGGDVSYKVALLAGTTYKITVTPTAENESLDLSISLLGPGDLTVCTEPVSCLVGADTGGGGSDDTFNYTPAVAGNYFVIIDSFYAVDSARSNGSFTIAVAVVP